MDEVDFYLEDLKSKFRKLKNVGGYDKYYLSYSGGKDSHFLYWFIKEYSYPEFKEDKKELEYKIAELLIEFSKKYDVQIKDIDLKDFNTFVDCCKYIVNIEVDL